jgi:hypothetical protein
MVELEKAARWREEERHLDGDRSRPFRVWFDAEHGCARFWAKGTFTGPEAKKMNDVEKQLMDELGKVHWLIEIGECSFDAAGRDVFVEAGKDPRNDKLAFVGLPAPVRLILSTMAMFKGRANQERQFSAADVPAAFAWFKQGGG